VQVREHLHELERCMPQENPTGQDGCRLCGAAAAVVVVVEGHQRSSLGRLCQACELRLASICRQVVRSAPKRARRVGHA
jgi:hypothetical protein